MVNGATHWWIIPLPLWGEVCLCDILPRVLPWAKYRCPYGTIYCSWLQNGTNQPNDNAVHHDEARAQKECINDQSERVFIDAMMQEIAE